MVYSLSCLREAADEPWKLNNDEKEPEIFWSKKYSYRTVISEADLERDSVEEKNDTSVSKMSEQSSEIGWYVFGRVDTIF